MRWMAEQQRRPGELILDGGPLDGVLIRDRPGRSEFALVARVPAVRRVRFGVAVYRRDEARPDERAIFNRWDIEGGMPHLLP